MIGLQFHVNRVIQELIKTLPDVAWSSEYNITYLPNTKHNLDKLFQTFKGIAYINGKYFFTNRPIHEGNTELTINHYRKRSLPSNYRAVPENYLLQLELRKYAFNTAKTYISLFEKFLNHFNSIEKPSLLTEKHINEYLQYLIHQNKSDSYLNQTINAIKFYYEQTLDMPNRFYHIRRPKKVEVLPDVLSQQEVLTMIEGCKNLKHKCIIMLIYSSGLRRGEVINLKIVDVDSKRMNIRVKNGKGKKDRLTLLSNKLLITLREYYKAHTPKVYLFEGYNHARYSGSSIAKIIDRSAKRAGINKKVTPHMLRHSFATTLLESGTSIRHIQALLGHNSIKTTEIYTHVATQDFKSIKNPLD